MLQALKVAAKGRQRRRTSIGRKLESTAGILHASKVLGDITNLVDEVFDATNNGRKASCTIKLLQKALPVIQSAVSHHAVKACAKVGTAVNYSVSRIRAEEKKRKSIENMQQLPSQRRKSDSFLSVSALFDESEDNKEDLPRFTPLAEISTARTLPMTRLSVAPFPATEETPEFPKPHNGAHYTPKEVVSILATFRNERHAIKLQSAVKIAMVKNGLVGPTTVRGLNKFLEKVTKSDGLDIPDFWNNKGRPGMLTLDELRLLAAKLKVERGHTIKLETFMPMVVDFLKDKYQKEGKATDGVDITPSKRTVSNMMALLAALNEQEILDFVPQPKTNTRYTAENSLMSAMAFAATVAGTHFIPGGMKPPTDMSVGASRMLELLRLANDVDQSSDDNIGLGLVQPQYIFSTDDTTQYIFDGKQTNGTSSWMLCNPEDLDSCGTRSLYETTEVNTMNGFRVKLTFTFSASSRL